MPKVYGSYKTGADIYKDRTTGRFYIIEWNPATQKTYKKFVAFKPDLEIKSKTIKSLVGKKQKTRKFHKNVPKNQSGGKLAVLGQIPSSECLTQVLNTESYKSILAQLNLADPQKVFKNIQTIRDRYTQKFAGKRLVDVIYNHPQPGKNQKLGKPSVLGQFNMCWNHGIGNPESITGGLPGIHLYVAADNNSFDMPNWNLVGVFIKNQKN